MDYFLTLSKFKQQRGVALVETLVLSGPVLLFLLGLPTLGKLIDAQQSSIQASRYLAWQQTIAEKKDTNEQIYHRFFSKEKTSTKPRSLVGRTQLRTSSNAMTSSIDAFTGQTGIGVAEKMGSAIAKGAKLLDRKNWDLEAKGIVRSGLSIELANNFIFGAQGGSCGDRAHFGCIEEYNGIMVDGWNAGNDAITERRSSSFVPTSKLEKVGKFLSNLGKIPMLEELEQLKHAFGCVPTAVLPGKTHKDLPKYRQSGGDVC